MRLEQLLSQTAARFGHKTAIAAGRGAHSYAELDRKSDRLAAALAERGVKRGARIAAYLDTGFAAVVSAFGAFKAGAALCPASPATGADSLARFLDQTGATGIVTETRLASRVAVALANAPAVTLVVLVGGGRSSAAGDCLSFEDVVTRIEGIAPGPAGDAADAAVVLRAAAGDGMDGIEVLSHAELALASSDAAIREDEIATTPLSIASPYGFRQLVSIIGAGATLVLDDGAVRRTPLAERGGFADVRLALV
jgi:acyl-CoA synthetase (AMP-forming)/AMP-acid ligase II